MSFLLDTNICSAHLRRPGGLAHRFLQHSGRLFVPTIVLGELYSWAYHRADTANLLAQIDDELLVDITVLDYDRLCALEFGRIRGTLLRQGISINTADLIIASVALLYDLTLVTHNTADFRHIPGLRIEDWLKP
jgi:tRNA(fMet)-specific endonuclease VapC